MSRGWPATLAEGSLLLRPLRWREAATWREIRRVNHGWLAEWEASAPDATEAGMSYLSMVRHWNAEARDGRMLPFAITWDGRLIGQVTVGGISMGSARSGYIGYWIDQRYAGRGITPTSVALVTDHCFATVGLHRVEINIRPENAASLRVVEKLGFRDEGVRLRYLHISGDWRDHRSFALTVEDVPQGLMARWRSRGRTL